MAEGDVLDIEGFVNLFAKHGALNNVVGQESYLGKHVATFVTFMGQLAPDILPRRSAKA